MRTSEQRVLTIPNALSLLRLSTIPVFVWLFLNDRENAGVIVYGAAAWTDFFDGYIARKLDQVTELGRLLDPLADRIFILALALMLIARGTLPWWLGLAIVVRDVLILSAFPLFERRGLDRIRVNFVGKSATASLLFGLTSLAYSETTFPGAGVGELLGLGFTVWGAVLYWVSAGMYLKEAQSKLRDLTRGEA